MTPRERTIALVAILAVFVFGGGLLGYQLILRPIKQAETRLRTLSGDLANEELKEQETLASLPRLAAMRRMSLPADPIVASREYGEKLEQLLRDSDFPAGKFSIRRKETDTRALPAGKKPPFQMLVFVVDAQGETGHLVGFLSRFYNTPLLHRVKTMRLDRPVTATSQQRLNELTISLTVEALIVDGAEKRSKLLPDNPEKPARTAREPTHYASIAGRDIFFGPPPEPRVPTTTTRPLEVKLTDCIHLDEITHEEKKATASLYDVLNNRRYNIRMDADGEVKVTEYYYLKDKRKFSDSGKELAIKDESGDVTVMTYKVVRIDATNLILESEGTYFSLHIGRKIGEVKELKASELKAMGLDPKDKKAEKKDEKKVIKQDDMDDPADEK